METPAEPGLASRAPAVNSGPPAVSDAQADSSQSEASAPAEPAAPSGPRATPRLVSLDAFRGLTIVGMLLVNNAALDVATPRQLLHAPWNQGVHFADLVFPWFLLIVGVAIPYSAGSHRRRGLPAWRYTLRAFLRAVGLFALGLAVDSSIAKQPVFGFGVLQLIGAAYLVGALLYPLPMWGRLSLAGAFLAAHWALIRFFPVPGVGPGVFTESQNTINHLNQVYLQDYGLRGLPSVVPTSALVLIGAALGDVLRRDGYSEIARIARVLGAGVALVALGWLWSLDIPFNKAVWTASYVLFTGGWGALALGLLYLLTDAVRWRAWAYPLVVFGANAIFAYVAPILVKVHILQEWTVRMGGGAPVSLQQGLMNALFDHAGRIRGGWLYTGGYIAFWWLTLLWLYRRRIFLRL